MGFDQEYPSRSANLGCNDGITSRDREIPIAINKDNITTSVNKNFSSLIKNGYIFKVDNLIDYIHGRSIKGIPGLDLPEEQWSRVFNISMRHQDYNHNDFSWPLEFSITDSKSRHQLQIRNLYLDKERRGKGEGKEMVIAIARIAQEFGYDRIYLSGGPYLDDEENPVKNILDWYATKFPKLDHLREKVEQNPDEAFLPIEAILEA